MNSSTLTFRVQIPLNGKYFLAKNLDVKEAFFYLLWFSVFLYQALQQTFPEMETSEMEIRIIRKEWRSENLLRHRRREIVRKIAADPRRENELLICELSFFEQTSFTTTTILSLKNKKRFIAILYDWLCKLFCLNEWM